jgi:DNA ligase-associated metallophosphoesterase
MKHGYLDITLQGETFYLLPQKALYRPGKQQLILSDLHLGKVTHFRKGGIALPPQSHLKDLDTLQFLLNSWQPKSVLLLGDLFHSDYNREWLWFKSLVMQYPQVQFILVEGNHDILQEQHYALDNFLKTGLLEEERFIFSHHPLEDPGKLNICGHLHPGLRIRGIARQAEKLPCFSISERQVVLPAFGNLTGLFLLEPEKNTSYFLVTGMRVVLCRVDK